MPLLSLLMHTRQLTPTMVQDFLQFPLTVSRVFSSHSGIGSKLVPVIVMVANF